MYEFLYAFFLIAFILLLTKVYIKLTTAICRSNVCLVGKTAIVTGANSGLGYETAADLAKRGARVILACRDPHRGKNAMEKIIEETNNRNVLFKQLDLSSFKSIREFAKIIKSSEDRLDILINNAGVGQIRPEKSEDGLLVAMQTNYFGHFLLTNLLLDLLKNTANSRIVSVSSISASYFNLDIDDLNNFPKADILSHLRLYGRSKLCQILFTIELAERLNDTNVTVYAVHPGVIPTEIWRGIPYILREPWMNIQRFFCKDILEGAQTIIYCSVAKEIEQFSGELFEECHVTKRYSTTRTPNLPKKLWERSEELVKLK